LAVIRDASDGNACVCVCVCVTHSAHDVRGILDMRIWPPSPAAHVLLAPWGVAGSKLRLPCACKGCLAGRSPSLTWVAAPAAMGAMDVPNVSC